MTADTPEKLDESVDDGSSLEKSIEHLDKDDPNYDSKRDKLLARLDEFKKELNKMRRQIKKQQKETRETLSSLRQKTADTSSNEALSQLIDKTKEDNLFLTRAFVELISAEGNLKQDMNRLASSKTFQQPLDMNILTKIQVKPLPTSQISKRKEQSKDLPFPSDKAALSAKIWQLRFSLPQRTFAAQHRQNVRTRERS